MYEAYCFYIGCFYKGSKRKLVIFIFIFVIIFFFGENIVSVVKYCFYKFCTLVYKFCTLFTGLVSSRASLTSWGEGASLALVGNPSSDGVTIKMPYPPRL